MRKVDEAVFEGRLQVIKNGRVVVDQTQLIVDTGVDWMAGRLSDSPPAAISHMAVGTAAAAAFTADPATDLLTVTGHGQSTGDRTKVFGLDLPAGLAKDTLYYINVASVDTFSLHTTAADAAAGTNAVDITDAGSGGHIEAWSDDTALGTELARVALASTSVSANATTYSATFLPGTGTGVLTEAGLFNDPAAGTMVCRAQFGDVTKDGDDELTINWTITVKK